MKKFYILFIGLMLMVSSCIPFAKMESGKTLGKGKSSLGGSVSSFSIKENENITTVPNIEIKYQLGISNKMDIGIGINGIGFVMLDGKYQVIGDHSSKFALSLGLGADALLIAPSNSDVKKNIKFSLPIYTSYHFNENGYYYFIPQFSKQFIISNSDDNTNFIGVSTGFGYYTGRGEINVGAAFFNPLNSIDDHIIQLGIGYKHRF